MRKWLLVNQNRIFDVEKAFADNDTVTWPDVLGADQGDVVYIYSDEPPGALRFRCIVDETGLSMMDDHAIDYVYNVSFYDGGESYVRLALEEEYPDELFTADKLKSLGIEDISQSHELTPDQAQAIEEIAPWTAPDDAKDETGDQDIEPDDFEDNDLTKPEPDIAEKVPGQYREQSQFSGSPGDSQTPGYSQTGGPNKKKMILAGVAGMLALLVIGFFTIHVYSEPDCYHPAKCKICGKTAGKALGHDWEEATCEAPKTCKRCHKKEGEPLDHNWVGGNCKTSSTCSRCHATGGPKGDHEWEEATYYAPKTCRICGTTTGDKKGMRYNVSGYWSDETAPLKWWTSTGVNIYKLYTPLYKCRWVKVRVTITESTRPDTSYMIWTRKDGTWTGEGVSFDGTTGSAEVTIEADIFDSDGVFDVDAFSTTPGDEETTGSYSRSIEVIEAQVEE